MDAPLRTLEVRRVPFSADLLKPGDYCFIPRRDPIRKLEPEAVEPPQGILPKAVLGILRQRSKRTRKSSRSSGRTTMNAGGECTAKRRSRQAFVDGSERRHYIDETLCCCRIVVPGGVKECVYIFHREAVSEQQH